MKTRHFYLLSSFCVSLELRKKAFFTEAAAFGKYPIHFHAKPWLEIRPIEAPKASPDAAHAEVSEEGETEWQRGVGGLMNTARRNLGRLVAECIKWFQTAGVETCKQSRTAWPSNNQQGSALFGLCLFIVTSMLCVLIVLYTTHAVATYSLAANRRAASLTDASIDAQLLNQISVNNSLMIVSLARALANYAEALHAGLGYQMSIPFWLSQAFENGGKRKEGQPLAEQESVADYYAAASVDVSQALQLAFRLNQNSDRAVSQLARRWGSQFQNYFANGNDFGKSTMEEVLCASLAHASSLQKSKIVVQLELSTLKTQQIANCVLRIGSFSVLSPVELLAKAKLSPQTKFGFVLLKRRKQLCRNVSSMTEEWRDIPVWKILKWKHFLNLADHQVILLHPRLIAQQNTSRKKSVSSLHGFYFDYCRDQSQPPDLRPLLEPNWAPVYLAERLGQ